MPLTVNGEIVPHQLIQQLKEQLSQQPSWRQIPDGHEKSERIHEAAEQGAIDSIIFQQFASADPRPVDLAGASKQFEERRKAASGTPDEELNRRFEVELRTQRAMKDLAESAPIVGPDEILKFHELNRDKFRIPGAVHARHVAAHIEPSNAGSQRNEYQARAVIDAAFSELNRGMDFREVVRRFSDCKEKDGDLGWFARGAMVQAFDDVVFALKPGERSQIFRTEFGFHIAECIEARPERQATFEEVSADIQRVLTTMAQHHVLMVKIQELRACAKVVRAAEAAA